MLSQVPPQLPSPVLIPDIALGYVFIPAPPTTPAPPVPPNPVLVADFIG